MRLWTLSRRRRVTPETRLDLAWKWTLCDRPRVDCESQMSWAEPYCVPSYNFIEYDLRSIVQRVDSGGVAVWVRVRMCVGGACLTGPRNLPADGVRIWPSERGTRCPRKLRNVVSTQVLLFHISSRKLWLPHGAFVMYRFHNTFVVEVIHRYWKHWE